MLTNLDVIIQSGLNSMKNSTMLVHTHVLNKKKIKKWCSYGSVYMYAGGNVNYATTI